MPFKISLGTKRFFYFFFNNRITKINFFFKKRVFVQELCGHFLLMKNKKT